MNVKPLLIFLFCAYSALASAQVDVIPRSLSDEKVAKVAELRLQQLQNFIKIIGEKPETNDRSSKMDAVRSAGEYFTKPCVIEVSNVSTGRTRTYHNAEEYFIHLMGLDYDRISIKFHPSASPTVEYKGGERYGVEGQYKQEFRAVKFGPNGKEYSDITIKKVYMTVYKNSGVIPDKNDKYDIIISKIIVIQTDRVKS
ncbi:MAG: hypothetical protein HUU01_11005 [Saprospiraceae bacterium]|nr:hypothetical protein [Saprospiraceae bacterium]